LEYRDVLRNWTELFEQLDLSIKKILLARDNDCNSPSEVVDRCCCPSMWRSNGYEFVNFEVTGWACNAISKPHRIKPNKESIRLEPKKATKYGKQKSPAEI